MLGNVLFAISILLGVSAVVITATDLKDRARLSSVVFYGAWVFAVWSAMYFRTNG